MSDNNIIVQTETETATVSVPLLDGHVEEAVRQYIERMCGIDLPVRTVIHVASDLEALATWTETIETSSTPDPAIRVERYTVYRKRVELEGADTARAIRAWLADKLGDEAPDTAPTFEMDPGGGYMLSAIWTE